MWKFIGAILILLNVGYVYNAELELSTIVPAIKTNAKIIFNVEQTLKVDLQNALNTVWYKKPASLLANLDGEYGLAALQNAIQTFLTSFSKQNNLPSSIKAFLKSDLSGVVGDQSITEFVKGLSAGDSPTPKVSVSNAIIQSVTTSANNVNSVISDILLKKTQANGIAKLVRTNKLSVRVLNEYVSVISNIFYSLLDFQYNLALYLSALSDLAGMITNETSSEASIASGTLQQIAQSILDRNDKIRQQIKNAVQVFNGPGKPFRVLFVFDEMTDGILDELIKEPGLLVNAVQIVQNAFVGDSS